MPISFDGYLAQVSRETARMSWPGQMHPILRASTKQSVNTYFATTFMRHLRSVWTQSVPTHAYDEWHKERTYELSRFLERGNHIKETRNHAPTNYRDTAVACKLLDTFMHQLMKYENCRLLWRELHLVLDVEVFKKLRRLRKEYDALQPVAIILKNNPYKISYESYIRVQNQLWPLIEQLNTRPDMEYELRSRIELNVLWANS